MRGVFLIVAMFLTAVLLSASVWAEQPHGIRLDPNGISLIYPVMNTGGWLLTQPNVGDMYNPQSQDRITHWGDDFYAQDWARSCGQTFGQPVFAGISGQIVLAGERGPYGNTVVIYDGQTRFALKYSHLSEIMVQVGEYVLAGRSLLGRVGNTGNIQATGCSEHPGAHLHLSLHKNVADPKIRPITLTAANKNTGPTSFAAPFNYVTHVDLIKAADNPTVFASFNGSRIPVTAAAFYSHGWGFDKFQQVFNPLANRIISSGQLANYSEEYYFLALRDNSLLKAENNPAIYEFEDGQKRILSFDVFSCRNNRFTDAVSVPIGDRDRYQPSQDQLATGCLPHGQQALRDFPKFGQLSNLAGQSLAPDWSTYAGYPNWDPAWELRQLEFVRPNGQRITIFHVLMTDNPAIRFMAYIDQQTGEWFGWQGVD